MWLGGAATQLQRALEAWDSARRQVGIQRRQAWLQEELEGRRWLALAQVWGWALQLAREPATRVLRRQGLPQGVIRRRGFLLQPRALRRRAVVRCRLAPEWRRWGWEW